ncbi:glycosyltransferase family 2 protein [Paracnuella aquatica]|uniref:glycosyltransferase family 2 protein n=1 Tax=Paracnuella aquatica TaxID=2268757 RepID=UPI00138FE884|nr:glycosyltransferase family 2 protein [Paracnuella aquatica]
MQLSIIIVSYNVQYFLEQCLHSVRRATAGLEAEVIVVDNASTDGSMEYLQPRFPRVVFLLQKENMGFARACNLGWKNSSGKNVLFLNPDTILAEDTLHVCLNFLGQHPLAGAVGVHMIDGAGVFLKESKRGFPHPMTSLFKLTGLASLFPQSPLFARYYLGHLVENGNHEVDVLAGAFMMIPRGVVQKVGAFDEAFFMYGEDIDLSYRIQKAGFKNYYLAETSIIHFKGESTRKASLDYVRRFYGAMIIFVRKHYQGLGASLLRLALGAAIGASAFLSILGRHLWKKESKKLQPPTGAVAVVGTEDQVRQLAAAFDKTTPVQHLENLAATTPQQAQTLVLCEGVLSFKEIIAAMRRHPKAFRYRIHAAGSGSIVGSDNSSDRGTIINLAG